MTALYSIYIINKAGGLIYQYDFKSPETEVECTLNYPVPFLVREVDEKFVVSFGEKDAIKVGQTILAVNGETLNGKFLPSGQNVMDFLEKEENFPVSVKFGKPKLTTNERIMLASMFHSLFAISCKLSPVEKSSGIECLEAGSFKLHCYQTTTGIKFLVLTDPRIVNIDSLLHKIYELYGDYALKNPFYSLEMPVRCELFDANLQRVLEQTERSLTFPGAGTV